MKKGPKDEGVDYLVHQAREHLEKKYGSSWFHEVLTTSDVPLERPLHYETFWGDLYVETIREAVGADVSLDVGEFFGVTQPAGPVTREGLFRFYPRVFDLNQPYGWTIWSIQVPGWLLSEVLEVGSKYYDTYFSTSGMSYSLHQTESGVQVKDLRVNGKKFDPNRIYKMAVTEGIGRGGKELSRLLRLFFKPKDSGIPVWMAVEKRLRQMGSASASSSATSRGNSGAIFDGQP